MEFTTLEMQTLCCSFSSNKPALFVKKKKKNNDELVFQVFYRCSELQDAWDYVDFCLFKLTGVNINLSIGLCLYLDIRTGCGQVASDCETAYYFIFKCAQILNIGA